VVKHCFTTTAERRHYPSTGGTLYHFDCAGAGLRHSLTSRLHKWCSLDQEKAIGNLFAPVYFVFLSLLMTALTAKVVAMWVLGYSVIPVIFIIPTFNLITIICTVVILKNIVELPATTKDVSYEKSIVA
jgi:hypothetical protein